MPKHSGTVENKGCTNSANRAVLNGDGSSAKHVKFEAEMLHGRILEGFSLQLESEFFRPNPCTGWKIGPNYCESVKHLVQNNPHCVLGRSYVGIRFSTSFSILGVFDPFWVKFRVEGSGPGSTFSVSIFSTSENSQIVLCKLISTANRHATIVERDTPTQCPNTMYSCNGHQGNTMKVSKFF